MASMERLINTRHEDFSTEDLYSIRASGSLSHGRFKYAGKNEKSSEQGWDKLLRVNVAPVVQPTHIFHWDHRRYDREKLHGAERRYQEIPRYDDASFFVSTRKQDVDNKCVYGTTHFTRECEMESWPPIPQDPYNGRWLRDMKAKHADINTPFFLRTPKKKSNRPDRRKFACCRCADPSGANFRLLAASDFNDGDLADSYYNI